MTRLSDIWKNRKQIMEGIKNAAIKNEFVEEVSKDRYSICNSCDSKGDKCAVPGTTPCCNECGCSLSFKTRSLSSECPLGKWKAVISEKDEDKLEEL